MGQSAFWATPAGGGVSIGFTDAAHTRADGFQVSEENELRDGRVLGDSQRYVGSTYTGRSAWMYTPAGGTVRLGFTGAGYERSDGYQESFAEASNSAGQIKGTSHRYSGSVDLGLAAWVYNPGSGLTRLGLTTAEHTRGDGYQYSFCSNMTDTGRFAGYSNRYSGTNARGQSGWVYAPATGTTRVGLIDGFHTSSNGTQNTWVGWLNAAGQAAGTSTSYAGFNQGQSSWVYNPGTGTTRIGLFGPEFTSSDGVQYGNTHGMSGAGRVIGDAYRYSGTTFMGYAAWEYGPSGTTRIGLTDAQHTRADGYQSSGATLINDAGQAVGTSARYNGSTAIGYSGFFYDPATATNYPLAFSFGNDGYANTTPVTLMPGGTVLGQYDLFVGGIDQDTRGFLWSVANGFSDLGSLVSGGLSAAGWDRLRTVEGNLDVQTIIGYGNVLGHGGQAVYALVPAPGGLIVLAGAAGLAWRRRRML